MYLGSLASTGITDNSFYSYMYYYFESNLNATTTYISAVVVPACLLRNMYSYSTASSNFTFKMSASTVATVR